jgi:starch-binding outer membrane protein, SusD/RagB family
MKRIYIPLQFYRIGVLIMLILMAFLINSCEDFVEIDLPNNQLTGTVVFEDAATVNAAFAHIYSQLRENAFTSGSISGLSYLMGHYTDELTLYSVNLPGVQNYSNNTVLASDSNIKNLWATSYSLIYASNSILEGVKNSTTLSKEDKDRFQGEAYFLRAFIHFHLMNLFGDIPYIDTTDYRVNSKVSRLSEEEVYQKLIEDLLNAKTLLPKTDNSFANVRPNYWVASALLARVHLYNGDWQLALTEASNVISDGSYSLNTDLERVFLNGSSETLWQLDTGIAGTNTLEAFTFIFVSGPPPNAAISNHLINSFETGDARFTTWVGAVSDGTDSWYYPYKYKLNTPTGYAEEYSILFRLAELYLIAAEAHAQMGNLSEASDYLNVIRNRASLVPISTMNQNDLLDAILQERRIEFFIEQGHRFFDLKRTGQADNELSLIKPNWKTTNILLPIPESELILNPNLEPQNDGY